MKISIACAALAAILAVPSFQDASAATRSWKNSVGSGDWSVGANWTSDTFPPNQPPRAGDTARLAPTDGAARTIAYDVTAPQLYGFTVDLTGPGTGRTTFNMASGTLSNAGFIVGENGRATVNHSGGSFQQTDAALDGAIGYYAGGDGVYNLSGTASLSLAKDLYIGNAAGNSGVVNQNGGQVSVARDLLLAGGANAAGAYNLNSGTLQVGRGIRLSAGTLSYGSLNVAGGELTAGWISTTSSGSAVHLSSGTINVGELMPSQLFFSGGTLNVTGRNGLVVGSHIGNQTLQSQHTLKVANLLRIDPNAHLTLDGGTLVAWDIFRDGRFDFISGTLEITNRSGITVGIGQPGGSGGLFPASLQLSPSQTLKTTGSTVVFSALMLAGGALQTSSLTFGSVGQFHWTSGRLSVEFYAGNLVNSGGVLAPGPLTGSTDVIGNYTQHSGATLEMEIGGTANGSQYDFVNVRNAAQLGGELRLSLINGFVPTAQQTFEIVQAGFLFGSFTNADNGQRVPTTDGAGSFVVNYGPTSAFNPARVVLSGFQPSLSGDFDLDGDVDGADFLKWQRGESPTPLSAADLADWKAHYGTASNNARPNGAAVPEPATLPLLFAGALTIAPRRVVSSKPTCPSRIGSVGRVRRTH